MPAGPKTRAPVKSETLDDVDDSCDEGHQREDHGADRWSSHRDTSPVPFRGRQRVRSTPMLAAFVDGGRRGSARLGLRFRDPATG